jgi:hypothetical protein
MWVMLASILNLYLIMNIADFLRDKHSSLVRKGYNLYNIVSLREY